MKKTLPKMLMIGLSGASLLSACGQTPAGLGSSSAETQVIAASVGQALTAPSRADHATVVADFMRARGIVAAGLTAKSSHRSATGVTHVRMEQSVGGMPVYGAYVKAAFNDAGQLVHIIERVASDTTRVIPAVIGPQDALRTVMSELGYTARAELYRDPSVERVARIDDAGALRESFVVETWSLRGNLLDYTLVDGSGDIVSRERRTNNDRYNVFVEDPGKGPQTIINGPAPGGVESPNGWLGTGSQTTINITGNNAHAYLDADNNNAPDSGGTTVTNGDFLTAVDLGQTPATTSNRNVAIQNLFYLNNVIHDSLYDHGFVESVGNFQSNNFGRGGNGNDAVNAEGQDGGGTDNANFSTPTDGSAPRMQMYLWTGNGPDSFVTVGSSTYGGYASAFGGALNTTGINGALALYNDNSGVTTDGCEASAGSLSGRIALVDRGTCNFTVKVLNAQKAGAVGVIIMNNTGTDEAFGPGGTDRKVKIPSVMVSYNSGQVLRALGGSSANMRHNPTPPLQIDGDLDADVVFHEYGHGLTWRMIGGMSGPLAGAIGEGASDVVAFLHNGDDRIGEYAFSSALGIRRQPYAGYVGSYSSVTGGEVHNDGEIYAAAMYLLWQNYLQAGLTTNTVLDDFVGGMNYTPSTPSYEQMRDGMLQQAAGTGRECLIWRAFAAYGIGVGASGTTSPSGSVTIVESFALPASCQ